MARLRIILSDGETWDREFESIGIAIKETVADLKGYSMVISQIKADCDGLRISASDLSMNGPSLEWIVTDSTPNFALGAMWCFLNRWAKYGRP